ncbi:MAG: MAPEG family protein [Gammaproteobacteria bacterium]
MPFTAEQKGVAIGMTLGAAAAFTLVGYGILANPLAFDGFLTLSEKLVVVAQAGLVPIFFVMLAVGKLARHRMFTPEDIAGAGLTAGSPRAKLLQALLQNTLEQAFLALGAYFAWALIMPGTWLSVVPMAAAAFALGRVLFNRGYEQGAKSRALGFTLSFYVSATMLMATVIFTIQDVIF